MAKVPVYDTEQTTTAVAGTSKGARQSILPKDSFGVAVRNPEAIGNAMVQLGQQVDRIGDRMAETEAEDALVNYEREKNEYLFGEGGYYNKKGRDAVDTKAKAEEDLGKIRKKYSDNLKTPLSRDGFDRASNAHMTRDMQDMDRYSQAQFEAWENSTIQARVEGTIKDGSRYWNDPDRLAVSLELGREAVITAGQKQGKSGEAIMADLQTFNSSFYKGAVESALSVGVTEGQQIFDEVKDFLDGPDAASLRNQISQKIKVAETQERANQAVLIGTDVVNKHWQSGNARMAIIDEINRISDPQVRNLAMSEAMSNLNQRQNAVAEEQQTIFNHVVDGMVDGMTPAQFMATQPAEWEKLTGEQKAALLKAKDEPIKTDFELYTELTMLPKAELATVNPVDYIGQLAPTEYKQLVAGVQAARTNDTQAQVGWTRNAQITSAMTSVYGKAANQSYEEKATFMALVNSELAFREQGKGAPLNQEEFDNLINSLTVKAVVEKDWWPDSEEGIEDLPSADVIEISRYLQDNGIPATAPNIINAYNQAKQ